MRVPADGALDAPRHAAVGRGPSHGLRRGGGELRAAAGVPEEDLVLGRVALQLCTSLGPVEARHGGAVRLAAAEPLPATSRHEELDGSRVGADRQHGAIGREAEGATGPPRANRQPAHQVDGQLGQAWRLEQQHAAPVQRRRKQLAARGEGERRHRRGQPSHGHHLLLAQPPQPKREVAARTRHQSLGRVRCEHRRGRRRRQQPRARRLDN